MRYWKTATSAALAAALMLSMATRGLAENEAGAAKGTITGKVVDADGKSVEGATVRVMLASGKAEKTAAPTPTNLVDDEAKPKKKDKAKKGAMSVAETKTDADGAFKLDVPAGDYTVGAMLKGSGKGMSEKVTVAAGGSATVEIKLKAPKKKAV